MATKRYPEHSQEYAYPTTYPTQAAALAQARYKKAAVEAEYGHEIVFSQIHVVGDERRGYVWVEMWRERHEQD